MRIDIVVGALRFRIEHLKKLGVEEPKDFNFIFDSEKHLRRCEVKHLEKAIKKIEGWRLT